MAEGKSKTKKKASGTALYCNVCGTEFTGSKNSPTCPSCGETEDIEVLNTDGTPLSTVRKAVKPQGIPVDFRVDPTRNILEEAEDLEFQEFRRAMNTSIREAHLEQAQAKVLEARSKRLEAERKLLHVEEGGGGMGVEPDKGLSTPAMGLMNNPGMAANLFFKSLQGMDEKEREKLLDRLENNPQFALNLGMVLNPQASQQGGMGMLPFGLMNQASSGGESLTDMSNALVNLISASEQLRGGNSLEEKLDRLIEHLSQPKDPLEELDKILNLVEKIQPKRGVDAETSELVNTLKKLQDKMYELDVKLIETTSKSRAELADTVREVLGSQRGIDRLGEIATLLDTVEEIKNRLVDKKSGEDDVEAWIKKHRIELEEKRDEREYKKELAKIEAEKTKQETVGLLLQGALARALGGDKGKTTGSKPSGDLVKLLSEDDGKKESKEETVEDGEGGSG